MADEISDRLVGLFQVGPEGTRPCFGGAERLQDVARKAAKHAAETEASMSRLQVEVATAQAAVESANQRAGIAERQLDQARADLQAERDRHDTSLS